MLLEQSTEPEISFRTWLIELYYCSCSPLLPGPAWVLLSYILPSFFLALCMCRSHLAIDLNIDFDQARVSKFLPCSVSKDLFGLMGFAMAA